MTFDDALDYLQDKNNIPAILSKLNASPSRDKKGWVCVKYPTCKHGSGEQSHNPCADGVTPIEGTNKLYCQSCHWCGTVIDWYMELHNLDRGIHSKGKPFVDVVKDMAKEIGLVIDDDPQGMPSAKKNGTQNQFSSSASKTTTPPKKQTQSADFEQTKKEIQHYVEERKKSKEAQKYLHDRGLSDGVLDAFEIGFAPNWDGGRIIIPTTGGFTARAIKSDVSPRYLKKKTGGNVGIFNGKVLDDKSNDPVFVTEGAIDAMSIYEADPTSKVIAINSADNANKFITMLEDRAEHGKEITKTLIICMDNDNAGATGKGVLMGGLRNLGIPFITHNITGKYKDTKTENGKGMDANDLLRTDRAELVTQIGLAKNQATNPKPDLASAYIDTIFVDDWYNAGKSISTGFKNLDKTIGGLYKGVYVLGATSSLGKTTFTLQLADNLAEAGHDVMFFSLEQGRLELVTKSFSRMLYQRHPNFAMSSLWIREKNYKSDDQYHALMDVVEEYKGRDGKGIGQHLSLIEGNFNYQISQVENKVKDYIVRNGVKPIVFIDYLQILQTGDPRQSAKDRIDQIMNQLAVFSNSYNLTIFVVSSLNRSSYNSAIGYDAFKESGTIEYSASVVLGLQLKSINDNIGKSTTGTGTGKKPSDDEIKAKILKEESKNPRELEIVCLKNRFGAKGKSCFFIYNTDADYYKEDGVREDEKSTKR